MKNYATGLMIACLAIAVMVSPRAGADEGTGDLGTELRETWEALKDYTIEQKNALADDSDGLLAALDAKIDEAQVAAAEASGDAREQWDETVASLSDYRAEAAERFAVLQESSAEAWEDAKQSLAETLDSLQQSLDGDGTAEH